jgi:2-oxoglutarate ferredoxin oxidoreductase subunit alpha
VSYDPANHERMCEIRRDKILAIRQDIPPTEVHGDDDGTLVLGWGSTHGAIRTVVDGLRANGHRIAHVHLRHIHPFPGDLGDIMGRYDHVLVPELNLGQLVQLLRAEYLVPAISLPKIQGQPFKTSELRERILAAIGSTNHRPAASKASPETP